MSYPRGCPDGTFNPPLWNLGRLTKPDFSTNSKMASALLSLNHLPRPVAKGATSRVGARIGTAQGMLLRKSVQLRAMTDMEKMKAAEARWQSQVGGYWDTCLPFSATYYAPYFYNIVHGTRIPRTSIASALCRVHGPLSVRFPRPLPSSVFGFFLLLSTHSCRSSTYMYQRWGQKEASSQRTASSRAIF